MNSENKIESMEKSERERDFQIVLLIGIPIKKW